MLRIGAYAAALTLILIQCLGQTSIPRARTTAPVQELTSPTQGNGKQAPPACSTGFSASIDCSALDEAGLLYRRGDFQGAIAKYGEFLQQNPRSPDAYAGLIRAYLRQNNLEQATQTLAKGLLQIDSPRLRVAQGEVWFRQGKILDAEKELVRIVNSGYPEPRAYFGLWRIWNSVAMYKSAKKMIEKARELDIRDPDIEKAWIDTLTPTQRIKYLQDSLADVNH